MTYRQRLRVVVNYLNLTTPVGLGIASLARATVRRGPAGLYVAAPYRLPVPANVCFTVGNVVLCRRDPDWLLATERATLLDHEARHATQYAFLGLLLWPLYGLASAWSWCATGTYGAHNPFERLAGFRDGGYTDAPLRPWLARVVGALRRWLPAR